jgi:prepilin-type N-terminal cleavage/methylation domain-containing protein
MDMTQQKGFSLIEVLLSLMLTTTVAFCMLHLHAVSHSLLKQFILQTHASTLLDRIDEEFLLQGKNLFRPAEPYILDIEENREDTKVQISWFHHAYYITRTHRSAEFLSE